jgi:putative ABC transport system substrate-binding protein
VFTGVGDPVGQGVVASLARRGGNLTGLSAAVTETYPKRVQLLAEVLPQAARFAALFNMGNPALPPQWELVETAARALHVEAHLLDVRTVEDLASAFDTAVWRRIEGLVVGLDTPRCIVTPRASPTRSSRARGRPISPCRSPRGSSS